MVSVINGDSVYLKILNIHCPHLLRHYTAAGIPTVIYGAGPHNILEANAHGADEHLALDDLRKATEVVARTLADLLAG